MTLSIFLDKFAYSFYMENPNKKQNVWLEWKAKVDRKEGNIDV